MKRAFCTGDIHGSLSRIKTLCEQENTTKNDYLVICGDLGLNYFLDERDAHVKNKLAKMPITIIGIHGNHEERAWNIPSYKRVYNEELRCYTWVEPNRPNIIFPEDGIFYLKDRKCLCLGGAYSVDKYYRLYRGAGRWFESEQMTREEKDKILEILEKENSFDYIFSHTVPLKFERELEELFCFGINQDEVDKSMEQFLDIVEDKITYKHWFFGHYHDSFDLTDKVTILYHLVIELNL